MRARAPGKVVLSGAYAVLHGAPAIVSAVSRYAEADSERPASVVTPEVKAALGDRAAPWFDASALRDARGKLGLGSSAAILVASLAALELKESGALDDATLADRVLPLALAAHHRAQGGGSGIDVAASARGGTLVAQRGDRLSCEAAELPSGLVIEVWASGVPAVTAELVARVQALPERERALAPQLEASHAAVAALRAADAAAFIHALDAQHAALQALGDAAGVPIVTPQVAKLARLARRRGGTVLPSGAGGGDVALYVAREAPSAELRQECAALDHHALDLALHARGVHALE